MKATSARAPAPSRSSASTCSSLRTRSRAEIATSHIERSGSRVVSRWNWTPGQTRTLTSGRSEYLPESRMNSNATPAISGMQATRSRWSPSPRGRPMNVNTTMLTTTTRNRNVVPQRGWQRGGLLARRGLAPGRFLGAEVEGADSQVKRLEQRDRPPQHRDTEDAVTAGQRAEGPLHGGERAVAAPHRHGDLGGRAHHHALPHRLSADRQEWHVDLLGLARFGRAWAPAAHRRARTGPRPPPR